MGGGEKKVSEMKNTSYIEILNNLTDYFISTFNEIKDKVDLDTD